MKWFMRKRRQERLRRAKLADIITRADKLIYSKKLFANPHFSKNDLAVELGTNRTYIGEALLIYKHSDWRGYINSFRLRYYLEIARRDENRHVKICDLAEKCGFGSANTLNRYMRKTYGITASAYKKNLSTSLSADGKANTATLS